MDSKNACLFEIDEGKVRWLVLHRDRERMFADLAGGS
jgi:hypothetical protein